MTVHEASEMFHLDEKEVRKNYRARMIIGAQLNPTIKIGVNIL